MASDPFKVVIFAEHFSAFGRITHVYARIQFVLTGLLSKALNITGSQSAIILSDPNYFKMLSVFDALFLESDVADADKAKIAEYLVTIRKHLGLRDQILHLSWGEGKRAFSIKPFGPSFFQGVSQFFFVEDEIEYNYIASELHVIADHLEQNRFELVNYSINQGLFPEVAL